MGRDPSATRRCEREKWGCEREKWGSHATHRIPGATSKIQTVAMGPTHQPDNERAPHSPPKPALPALHRQMNAAKNHVLPTKETHGQQIAIPYKYRLSSIEKFLVSKRESDYFSCHGHAWSGTLDVKQRNSRRVRRAWN